MDIECSWSWNVFSVKTTFNVTFQPYLLGEAIGRRRERRGDGGKVHFALIQGALFRSISTV